MPLQFETKSAERILCFVPSGVFEKNGWEDFKGQIAQTCMYNSGEFLARLCFTTKPFNSDQSPILKGIFEYKSQLVKNEGVNTLILRILLSLNAIKDGLDDNAIPQLIASFSKLPFNFDSFFRCLEMFLPNANLELHFAELKKIQATYPEIINSRLFADSLPKFTSLFTKNITPEAIFNSVNDYFYTAELENMRRLFGVPEFKQILKSNRLDFEKPNINEVSSTVAQKVHYRRSIIQHFFNLQMWLTNQNVPQKDVPSVMHFKAFIRTTLENRGPIQISGLIGIPSYLPNSTFDIPGKMVGSRLLVGFKKDTYRPDPKNGHAVIIIGLMDDFVIYLDPYTPSEVGEQRKAYVVSLDRMFTAVKEHANNITRGVINIYYNDPSRIDTTPEMLKLCMPNKGTLKIGVS